MSTVELRGLLLNWGKNENGYRWVDVGGFRLDAGKNGVPDSVIEALVGSMVKVIVETSWVERKDGSRFVRRKLVSVRALD